MSCSGLSVSSCASPLTPDSGWAQVLTPDTAVCIVDYTVASFTRPGGQTVPEQKALSTFVWMVDRRCSDDSSECRSHCAVAVGLKESRGFSRQPSVHGRVAAAESSHALSVYVALLVETLDFKDCSEPLMRQLTSRVEVPDQPRLHYPYVVAVADAHLQVMTVRIDTALKHRPGATNNAPAFLQLPVFLHVLVGVQTISSASMRIGGHSGGRSLVTSRHQCVL